MTNISSGWRKTKSSSDVDKVLKLIKDHSIVCHYKVDDREATMKLSKDLRQNIIAIPEKAGGYITEGMFTNYGTEPIVIVQGDRVDAIHPNSSIKLEARR